MFSINAFMPMVLLKKNLFHFEFLFRYNMCESTLSIVLVHLNNSGELKNYVFCPWRAYRKHPEFHSDCPKCGLLTLCKCSAVEVGVQVGGGIGDNGSFVTCESSIQPNCLSIFWLNMKKFIVKFVTRKRSFYHGIFVCFVVDFFWENSLVVEILAIIKA